MRKCLLYALSLLFVVSAITFVGCKKKNNVEENGVHVYSYAAYLSSSQDAVSIGLSDSQKWKFVKSDGKWLFDGVYTAIGGTEDRKIFAGSSGKLTYDGLLNEDGAYLTVQPYENDTDIGNQIGSFVTGISVLKDSTDEKSIGLSGQGFYSVLTVRTGSPYVERTVTVSPSEDTAISEGELSFTLKTEVDKYIEQGYILTWASDKTQTSVPYSFPAITSRIKSSSETVAFTTVMDYSETFEGFKTARRNKHLNGFIEVGFLSSANTVKAGESYTISEHIAVEDGADLEFYDMIYSARKEYGKIYSVPVEVLSRLNGNMNVSQWTDAAYGATYDILDKRGRPVGDDAGTWGPYAYQNGSAEAFGALDILKGMTRYAIANNDSELLKTCEKYLLQFVERNEYNTSYIMPLNLYYPGKGYTNDYYFYRAYSGNGSYAPEDSWNSLEPRIGSFKYYSRVINLGELGILTGNKTVQRGFLNLLPLIKKLRGPNFEQDVEWNFDLTPANMDYENGGSAGAMAMWSRIMYLAYLTESDTTAKNEYLELCKGSIKAANEQDFDKTSALREYPKPESLSYMAEVNVSLYEMTNDSYYLENAIEKARAVHFYYYSGTSPFTYFQTVGFGYACTKERWEAFMEMVETLVILTPVLKYTDDPLLYDLYYSLENSALWTLPVNGYPEGALGGHSDWLDALYVPFEQPTAAKGDNTGEDGGGSSYLRHSKELYGAGEIFTGALTFEAFAKTDNDLVSVYYTNPLSIEKGEKNKNFRLWNASSSAASATLFFPLVESGNYKLLIDGQLKGVYSSVALKNGIKGEYAARTVHSVSIEYQGSETAVSDGSKNIALSVKEATSSYTVLNLGDFGDHCKITVSDGASEKEYLTVKKEVTVYHESSSELYVKAEGYTADGLKYGEGGLDLKTSGAEYGVVENFSYTIPDDKTASVGGYETSSKNYGGAIRLLTDYNGLVNYPTEGYGQPKGYMAVYKPTYQGEDVDTFQKQYSVNLSEYPYLDFYPFTKNVGSVFTLSVIIDGNEIKLFEGEYFDKYAYRYDLGEAGSGEKNITVKFTVSGKNRGFALSGFAFLNDTVFTDGKNLTALDYTVNGATVDYSNGLYFKNESNIDDYAKNVFDLGNVDTEKYSEMEIKFGNLNSYSYGKISAKVCVGQKGSQTIFENDYVMNRSGKVVIPFSEIKMENGKRYEAIIKFFNNSDGSKVKNIIVNSLKFNAERGVTNLSVYNYDGQSYSLSKGWVSNYANINENTGLIYNNDSSKNYSSISYRNLIVNLDVSPIVRINISQTVNSTYAFKINDGTMATDLTLIESGETGIFSFNLRDVLGRSGIISLTLEMYVIHGRNVSYGAKVESITFVAGDTVYENTTGKNYSEAVSEEFSLDLDSNSYLNMEISELTYGSSWKAYIEADGVRYEIKTIYEKVYGKMYFRGKKGAFSYNLKDITGLSGSVKAKIIIMLNDNASEMRIISLYLTEKDSSPVINGFCRVK